MAFEDFLAEKHVYVVILLAHITCQILERKIIQKLKKCELSRY